MIKNIAKKDILSVMICYVLWGFQSLYWSAWGEEDSFLILGCRIIMTMVFAVSVLAASGRLGEYKAVFYDRDTMKFLVPAAFFMLLDWGVFIVVVNSGHVLDTSLGYYISPLLIFAVGVVVYHERCEKFTYAALGIAAAGVVISAAAFGNFPFIPLIVAGTWTIYASIKKSVHIDGLISIAVETTIIAPLAVLFLVFSRREGIAAFELRDVLFALGSGVVTGLPMVLYSDAIRKFPLTAMCFIQYLSPTFALFCGLIVGESFTKSQLVSLAFFITAIVFFTAGELRTMKKGEQNAERH